MKLNLFKKSGHFDRLRDEYVKLSRQFDEAQQELTLAEGDLQTKDQAYQRCRAQSNVTSTRFSGTEKELLLIRNQAEQHWADMKSKLADLQFQHRALQWKVESPAKMQEAKEMYEVGWQ